MDVRDPIVPRQTDRIRPAIKEYRFGEGEEFDPVKARILQFESWMSSTESWELAEFQVYGHGYALDAAYATEIVDVGTAQPRFRRYFDPNDPDRPIAMEKIQTFDGDDDGSISASEQAGAVLAGQFDPGEHGNPVTWGRVRWHGRIEGGEGNAEIRVRSGSTLDTRIYQRKVGRGVAVSLRRLPHRRRLAGPGKPPRRHRVPSAFGIAAPAGEGSAAQPGDGPRRRSGGMDALVGAPPLRSGPG